MNIEGFSLPPELLTLINEGRWHCPSDPSGLDRLFPDRGEFCLFDFEQMRCETSGLRRILAPATGSGHDPEARSLDLDPHRMIMIADLGIGYDQPIALDYGASAGTPRVVTLQWGSTGGRVRWVEVARDIETFAALLGL